MKEAGPRWLELAARCPTDPDAAALVVEALLSLGGRAAEEREGWILTHVLAPGGPAEAAERVRARVREVAGLEGVEVRSRWREHEEWSETWKRGLGPRRITERILVRPSWTPAPDAPPQATIVLDPGMAFGTAEHGTTRGCLRLLDETLGVGDSVLDVGAGSGILAVAAALLGARACVAVEADPLSFETLLENVERNGVGDRVRCVRARVDAEDILRLGPVSGVVANIETGVLRPLLAGFAGALLPGGWLILSGILDAEWSSLRSAAEAEGLRFARLDEDGEWRSASFVAEGGG
jgi:ribosomal protein L11 methyltransferase